MARKPPKTNSEPKKTRYAIYARVSTTLEAQASSYKNQMDLLKKRVEALHPGFEFVRVYGDFGISGAKEKRPEFDKMISDAKAGEFDVIVTKSISRFARNCRRLLDVVNDLEEHNVGIIFMEEHIIETRSPNQKFYLTILAALAEMERENTKAHIKETFAMKHAAGKMAKPYTKAYGYRIEKGQPVIVEEQAAVVRQIFTWFVVDGFSAGNIARRLNANKIRNPRYEFGKGWSRSEIKNLLANSKYCGRPKETSENGDEYFFEGPAIIDEATYNASIKLLEEYSRQPKVQKMRSMVSNFQPQKYPLSGLCKCAVCGGKVSRYTRISTLTTGKYPLELCEPAIDGTPLWGCLRNGSGTIYGPKCDTYKISEQYLYEMIIEAISHCFYNRFTLGIQNRVGSKNLIIVDGSNSSAASVIKEESNVPVFERKEIDFSAIGIPLYEELVSSINNDASDKYNEEKAEYDKKIKEIDKKIQNNIRMGENGTMSLDAVKDRVIQLRKEKSEIIPPKEPEQVRVSAEQLKKIKEFFEGESDLTSANEVYAALRMLFEDGDIRRSLVRSLVEEVIIGGENKCQATIKIKGFEQPIMYHVEHRAPRRWGKHIRYDEVEYMGEVYLD